MILQFVVTVEVYNEDVFRYGTDGIRQVVAESISYNQPEMAAQVVLDESTGAYRKVSEIRDLLARDS